MTSSEDAEPVGKPDLTTVVDWFRHPDVTLVDLAEYADGNGGLSVPLTLYLPWGIASGFTTSAENFYRLVQAAARQSETGGELVDIVADKIFGREADNAHTYRADLDAMTEDQRIKEDIHQGYYARSYLHLREATTVVGGFSHQVAHLRVRLADITAWSYGRFEIGA